MHKLGVTRKYSSILYISAVLTHTNLYKAYFLCYVYMIVRSFASVSPLKLGKIQHQAPAQTKNVWD